VSFRACGRARRWRGRHHNASTFRPVTSQPDDRHGLPISPMLPPRPDRFGSIRQAACWLPCCSMAVAIHSSGYSTCTRGSGHRTGLHHGPRLVDHRITANSYRYPRKPLCGVPRFRPVPPRLQACREGLLADHVEAGFEERTWRLEKWGVVWVCRSDDVDTVGTLPFGLDHRPVVVIGTLGAM